MGRGDRRKRRWKNDRQRDKKLRIKRAVAKKKEAKSST